MNKLMIFVSIFLVVNHAIAQSCKTIVLNQTIFPTTTETLSLELTSIFQGQNLTFGTRNPLATVLNYANPVDNGNTLPSGVTFIQNAIYTNQNDEEWNGQTAFLGTNNTQVLVFPSNFSNIMSPSFDQAIILQQQEGTTLNCLGLTYLNSDQVIVDCYNIKDGLLVNEWQIVETGGSTNQSQVVPSSNNQNLKSGIIGFGRTIQLYRNSTSGNEYILRATLNNQGGPSMLEIFLIEDSLPQVQPIVTLSNLNITNLQIVDFDIEPKGRVFILNQTNVLITYTLDETNQTLINEMTMQLDPQSQYLAINIGLDFKFPTSGGYSFLLATTTVGYNIEEWIVIGTNEPLQSGFYAVPAYLATGIPTQMDISTKYVLIHDRSTVYLFERGVADYKTLEFQQFYQNEILFTFQGIYAELNKVPQALLVFTPSRVQVSLLKQPAIVLVTKVQQNGSITLIATSYLKSALPVTCTATVNYDVILASNTSILQTGQIVLPNTALFPFNTTIDISKYFSGPLINLSGIVTTENQSLQASAYSSNSTIVETTVTQFQINVEGYPTSGIVFAQNSYDKATNTLLQFVQTSQQLTAYLCYRVNLDINSNCFFIGTLNQTHIISKLAVMYLNQLIPNAYLIVPSSNTSIDIYEVSWSQRRSINSLYTSINFTQNDVPINITDFMVLGDRLFVVLNQINEIWIYSISNNSTTRLNQITSQNFPYVVFSPTGIVGNFQTYGPTIFINNKFQTLIVSTVGDQIQLVGTILYPITQPDMTTIKLVGSDLIIVQYKGGSFLLQQITQYNLYDLTNPVIVKTLPLYGGFLVFPLIIASDSNFLYVVMLRNVLNIYKPSASQHETLFKQITKPDIDLAINIFVSAASDGVNSYVIVGNRDKIISSRLNTRPTLTFVPGQYNNEYYTSNTFTVTMTNSLGSVPIVVTQNISTFNPQQDIKIDAQKYNSTNINLVVTKRGSTEFNLDPTKFISGPVARYSIECSGCTNSQVTPINYLMPGNQFIGNLTGIQAMTNHPGQNLTFVQNLEGIYSVSSTNLVKKVCTFQVVVRSCSSLSFDEVGNNLISVCDSEENPQSIITVIQFIRAEIISIRGLGFQFMVGVSKANLVGQTAFLLGYGSDRPTIFVVDHIRSIPQLTQSLNCNDPTNNGINDFTLIAIKNFVSTILPNTNQTVYALIWTCQAPGLGVQYTTFVLDEYEQTIGTIQTYQTLDTSALYPSDSSFQQIQTLTKSITSEKTSVNVILTTENQINLILQISFTFMKISVVSTSARLVTVVPTYGLWIPLNSLSYSSGLLAIAYTKDEKNFLALYNLNDLNYDQTSTIPLIMIGGYYQDVNSTYDQQWVYNIQEAYGQVKFPQTQILTSNSQLDCNLSSIVVNPHLQIVVKVDGPSQQQQILVTAQNDYSAYIFKMNINYNLADDNEGIKWWGWTLISLAILLVVSGMIIGLVKFMKGKKEVSEQTTLLVN